MNIIKYLGSFIPQRLPVSRSELEAFTNDIVALGGWNDSIANRGAIAQAILHLTVGTYYVSKRSFYLAMRRSLTNQVAYAVMTEAQEEQRKQALLEVEAANVAKGTEEVTGPVGA